ncbi:MAG: galactitol-1-phosphate 5-dehydrogenase [Ruminococcus sp.]|nr:galactitol-1-phosphate 5-dehydrogenase [Ruminococcus sp.]
MKAWVLHGIRNMRLETWEDPMPADGEVVVAVKAAGICGSDIPRIYETGAHMHPLIIGHEFSGIVTGLGAGVDVGWLGKRVGISPLIPCGKCLSCQKRAYEMCRNYDYLGSRRNGGFAEYASVPAGNLVELPSQVTFEEAALLEPMAVAVHAMRRARISVSDTIVICGLGTIGLLLLMFLLERKKFEKEVSRQFSGKILAIGNKESQRRMAVKMGLREEYYCDSSAYPVGKWLTEHTGGRGANLFFECVGKNETFEQAVNYTAVSGKVILAGNPYSDMKLDRAVYWKILRNQLTIKGTWNSSFTDDRRDDWHYVMNRLVQKRIAPVELITHRFSLERLAQGLEIMHGKSEDYIKIMVAVNKTTRK